VAHQRLALVAQANVARVPLEERGAENLLQLADGVADRARRQVQLGGSRPEGPCPAGGLEGPEKGERHRMDHAISESESTEGVNIAFVRRRATANTWGNRGSESL
jgi:hypothetical protein